MCMCVVMVVQTEDWGDFIKRTPFQAYEIEAYGSDDSGDDDDEEEWDSDEEEEEDSEDDSTTAHRTSVKSQ